MKDDHDRSWHTLAALHAVYIWPWRLGIQDELIHSMQAESRRTNDEPRRKLQPIHYLLKDMIEVPIEVSHVCLWNNFEAT